MCKYVYLQLSDLHFGYANGTTNIARDILKTDIIKRAVEQQFHYDGLIVSGDIIDGRSSNKKKAYKEACEYLLEIQDRIAVSKSRTYIVPGNHDIDLNDHCRNTVVSDIRRIYNTRNGIISEGNESKLMPNSAFTWMYRKITQRKFFSGHSLFSDSDDIDFLCLDSSLLCTTSKDDFGKIILGVDRINTTISSHEKEKRLVVVAHHRYDWLLESEKREMLRIISRNNAVLFCCGHVHSAESFCENSLATHGTQIVVSVAPTLSDDEQYSESALGYNIIHVDTDNDSIYIESYMWNSNPVLGYSLNWSYPNGSMETNISSNPLQTRKGLRINSCELYFARTERKMTIDDLAEATNIEKRIIRRYEKLIDKYTVDSIQIFPECDRSLDIVKLSYALKADMNNLIAHADYPSTYPEKMEKYRKQKGVRNMPQQAQPTRVVVFDFDGTVTKNESAKTSWERMWVSCGCSEDECRSLHQQYMQGQFDHQEWCNQTLERFAESKFSTNNIASIAAEIKPLDDYKEVLKYLHNQGIALYIVSGSVDVLIKRVLGEDIVSLFTKIQANQMQFDNDGILSRIIGTKYDFEGKARYINGIIQEGYQPNEIVFFGNSFNDESVCSTGVRSVCINPKNTVGYDTRYWSDEKANVSSMKELLQFISIGNHKHEYE